MKIVSYNIQYGFGRDRRMDFDRIAEEIRGADIIALQEVTRHFFRNENADMVAIFENLFPDYFTAFGPACEVDAGSTVEDGKAVIRRFQFGNMILSRFPILSVRNLLLPRTRTWDKLNLQRSAVESLIMTPNGPLRVYSVHLDHRASDERVAQVKFLKDRALSYGLEGGALTGASEFGLPELPHTDDFVLLGDFNMTPESPEYITMCGTRDATMGRTVKFAYPVDALKQMGKVSANSVSWIDEKGEIPNTLLDHIFVNAGLVPRLADGGIMTDAKGSDHLPVWVELK